MCVCVREKKREKERKPSGPDKHGPDLTGHADIDSEQEKHEQPVITVTETSDRSNQTSKVKNWRLFL